jgi:2-polyprenyl-6-methoxyphenol hydroxylase-like FAD-dependent oxidoreductase
MLYRLALSVGAVVTFNATVTAAESTTTPSVHLANGTTLTADLIIGADGAKSIIREIVTEMEDSATDSGYTFYTCVVCCDISTASIDALRLRAIVPIERMVRDPELAKWAHVPQVSHENYGV